MDRQLTLEDLEKYKLKHGSKQALRVLSVLGKNAGFVQAVRTELGQLIMQDLIVRMEVILEKIIDNTVKEEERIEYKLSRDLLDKWTARILTYERELNKLKGG